MTITEEHIQVLREVREAARDLQLACVEATGLGSLIHMAFDRTIETIPTKMDSASIHKLRLVAK